MIASIEHGKVKRIQKWALRALAEHLCVEPEEIETPRESKPVPARFCRRSVLSTSHVTGTLYQHSALFKDIAMDRVNRTIDLRAFRPDWKSTGTAVSRHLRRCISDPTYCVANVPRHWLPLLEYFRIRWARGAADFNRIPWLSDLTVSQIKRICKQSAARGNLRGLVEMVAAGDPFVAELLHALDLCPERKRQLAHSTAAASPPTERVRLASWSAFGRPEIVQFCEKCCTSLIECAFLT